MIEMQHRESDSEVAAEIIEHPQKRHRIGAARHRDSNAIARPEHPVPGDRLKNASVQIVRG
jgi:hypothetical protein